jgi:hypothetical protein
MLQPLLVPVTDRAGTPIQPQRAADALVYSSSGTLLARGYARLVIGGRGAYIEFAPDQMVMDNLHIPQGQEWRLQSEHAYYLEHRSRDEANVKVYEQRRTVGYADYRIGMFYIAPAEVIVKSG